MDGWTDCQMETQADRHDIRAQLLRTGGLEWEHSSQPSRGALRTFPRSLPRPAPPWLHPGPAPSCSDTEEHGRWGAGPRLY